MPTSDYDLNRSQWEQLIDEWILGPNAERNRAILKRRLLDGVLMEPLAEEFGLSVRHTRNIVRKGLEILTKHI